MGHLLPGPTCSDEGLPLIRQVDHGTCLDKSLWDPGADDSSRVSAQEDTTAHIGYNVIHIKIVFGGDEKWHIGGPNSTMDSGQFHALYFVESVVGDPRDDTSSEGPEVAPHPHCDQESHYLAG
jgi:hypothetical protein